MSDQSENILLFPLTPVPQSPAPNEAMPPHQMPLNVGDWAADVAGFTLEQEGFFVRLIRTLWGQSGRLRNDEHRIAKRMSVQLRTYRKMMAFLIEERKIEIVDGNLTNRRLTHALQAFATRRAEAAANGRRGSEARKAKALEQSEQSEQRRALLEPCDASTQPLGEVQAKFGESSAKLRKINPKHSSDFNDATMALPYPSPLESSTPYPQRGSGGADFASEKIGPRRRSRLPKCAGPNVSPEIITAAFDAYNAAAATHGFSAVAARTDKRVADLRRRLLESGTGDAQAGLEQFRNALSAIPHDEFLAGRKRPKPGDTPFRLDFERLLSTGSKMGDVLARLIDIHAERGPAKARSSASLQAERDAYIDDIAQATRRDRSAL